MAIKILYVEDEEDIQAIVRIALEILGGFTVKICSSGEEALREAGAFGPDLILLDVMMPGMDGLETLAQLRRHAEFATVPVVFMTARIQPVDILHYRNLGVAEVIAKPFDPMALPGKVQAIVSNLQSRKNTRQKQLLEQIVALRKNFAHSLPAKINAIKKDWHSFKNQTEATVLTDLIRKTHGLSGSGATFNFPAISQAAQFLEAKLRHLNIDPASAPAYADPAVDELVAALENAALSAFDEDSGTAAALAKIKETAQSPRGILLICDNAEEAISIHKQLCYFALNAKMLELCQDVPQIIKDNGAADIFIIQGDPQTWPACIANLAQIKNHTEERSFTIIAVSSDDRFTSRLNAVRAQADAYFLSPVKMAELVNYIRTQLLRAGEHAYRILIVEDDMEQAHFTAFLLEQAGMVTDILSNPMAIMEVLNNFYPELILIDLNMPSCNGLELAAVIRQYPEFMGISIVFLSMDNDIDRQIQALRAGGDEFIVKTLTPDRLLVKLEAKVKHARLIQTLMLRDGLTGLLNRSSIDEYLAREIHKVKRQNGLFSYVMLDLDHFKGINDRYGHTAGDDVLKSLGLLLRQRLRATDLAGRYGGEEFALILPGAGVAQAQTILEDFLQLFRKIKFNNGKEDFYVTFSAGIAGHPDYSEPAALIEAADHALYQAKAKGRNQICIAPENDARH